MYYNERDIVKKVIENHSLEVLIVLGAENRRDIDHTREQGKDESALTEILEQEFSSILVILAIVRPRFLLILL